MKIDRMDILQALSNELELIEAELQEEEAIEPEDLPACELLDADHINLQTISNLDAWRAVAAEICQDRRQACTLNHGTTYEFDRIQTRRRDAADQLLSTIDAEIQRRRRDSMKKEPVL